MQSEKIGMSFFHSATKGQRFSFQKRLNFLLRVIYQQFYIKKDWLFHFRKLMRYSYQKNESEMKSDK